MTNSTKQNLGMILVVSAIMVAFLLFHHWMFDEVPPLESRRIVVDDQGVYHVQFRHFRSWGWQTSHWHNDFKTLDDAQRQLTQELLDDAKYRAEQEREEHYHVVK